MKGLAMLLHSWLKQAYPHLDWSDPGMTLRSMLPEGFDLNAFITQVRVLPTDVMYRLQAIAEQQNRIEALLAQIASERRTHGSTGNGGGCIAITDGSDRN